MIVARAPNPPSRAPGASVILTPLAIRPACLPHSIAFSAARLPAPASGNEAPLEAWMGDLHALLPPELEPAASKRRTEFLGGRLCAREAARRMKRSLHILRRGPNGEPIWPSGLAGSIAHSNRIACAVVADASTHRAIGIDIEPLCSAKDAEQLASMVFAPGERVAIGPWPQGEGDLFTTVFSLKEAIYKSLYPMVRRFIDFDEIRLLRTGAETFTAEVSTRLMGELGDWRLQLAVDRLADHRFALSIAVPVEGGRDGA